MASIIASMTVAPMAARQASKKLSAKRAVRASPMSLSAPRYQVARVRTVIDASRAMRIVAVSSTSASDMKKKRNDIKVAVTEEGKFTLLSVTSPDRPGLLKGITSALTKLNVSIQRAVIDSPNGLAVDKFYVQDVKGGPVPKEKLLLVEGALMDACETATERHAKAAGVMGIDPAVFRKSLVAVDRYAFGVTKDLGAPAEVKVVKCTDDTVECGPCCVAMVSCPDKQGLLSNIMQIFGEYEMDLKMADIKTENGRAMDKFFLMTKDGEIPDPSLMTELQQDLVDKLEGRSLSGRARNVNRDMEDVKKGVLKVDKGSFGAGDEYDAVSKE